MSDPPLHCDNLVLGYGGHVLSECQSLTVERCTIVGVIGPNGCGKTTLLNIVSGWQTPVRGVVKVCGVDVIGNDPSTIACLGVRRSFQGGRVLEGRTLVEQMALCHAGSSALSVTSLLDQSALQRWEGRARRGLTAGGPASAVADQKLQTLSGGFQRLGDALSCLYGATHLCALDEPFAGLAEALRMEIQSAIVQRAASGAGIIIIDHDRDRLSSISHVLYEFRVAADGIFRLQQA